MDSSYEYHKMFVIRTQLFVPNISLLRNASLNTLSCKQYVQVMKKQHIDFTKFEAELNTFKTSFSRNYHLASDKFKLIID